VKGTDRYEVGDVICEFDGERLRVVNLSVSGFFVESESAPLPGSTTRVGLTLPGQPRIEVEVEVAWVNDPANPRNLSLPGGFGVKLRRGAFQDRMAILRYLGQADPAHRRGV